MADVVTPFYVTSDDPPAKRAALQAALRLFADRGIDGVTVRDIAAVTGFSNPAIFRHYRTKDELARALFETCYRQLAGTLAAVSEARGLEAALAAAFALVDENPEAVHFVIENLRRFFRQLPDDLRAISILGIVRRAIRSERARGELRDDLNPDLGAAVVLGALGQLARMRHFNELDQPMADLHSGLWQLLRGAQTHAARR